MDEKSLFLETLKTASDELREFLVEKRLAGIHGTDLDYLTYKLHVKSSGEKFETFMRLGVEKGWYRTGLKHIDDSVKNASELELLGEEFMNFQWSNVHLEGEKLDLEREKWRVAQQERKPDEKEVDDVEEQEHSKAELASRIIELERQIESLKKQLQNASSSAIDEYAVQQFNEDAEYWEKRAKEIMTGFKNAFRRISRSSEKAGDDALSLEKEIWPEELTVQDGKKRKGGVYLLPTVQAEKFKTIFRYM